MPELTISQLIKIIIGVVVVVLVITGISLFGSQIISFFQGFSFEEENNFLNEEEINDSREILKDILDQYSLPEIGDEIIINARYCDWRCRDVEDYWEYTAYDSYPKWYCVSCGFITWKREEEKLCKRYEIIYEVKPYSDFDRQFQYWKCDNSGRIMFLFE